MPPPRRSCDGAGVVCCGTTGQRDRFALELFQPLVPFAQIVRRHLEQSLETLGGCSPPCSAASIRVSVKPSSTAGPSTGSPAFCNSPCLSVIRQPSRLPLSTVER